MIALHGPNPPEALFRIEHRKIMELIWEHAARALHAGTHVILDVGFWTRASRDDARRRAMALDVPCRFYSLTCAEETARARVLQRTGEHPPGALFINEAAFDLFAAQFEPMGPDEAHTEIRESAPFTS
jgi:predicted kinase